MFDKLAEKFTAYCSKDGTQLMLQEKVLDPLVKYVVNRLWNYIVVLISFLTCHLVILAWLLFRVTAR
jgi:hypothetical protein